MVGSFGINEMTSNMHKGIKHQSKEQIDWDINDTFFLIHLTKLVCKLNKINNEKNKIKLNYHSNVKHWIPTP